MDNFVSFGINFLKKNLDPTLNRAYIFRETITCKSIQVRTVDIFVALTQFVPLSFTLKTFSTAHLFLQAFLYTLKTLSKRSRKWFGTVGNIYLGKIDLLESTFTNRIM